MHHALRLPFALGALMLFLAGTVAVADVETHEALLGKPAPNDVQADFAVNGKPVKMADLKGKVVLLTFWGMWSSPSREILPHLQQWDYELKDRGLAIVAVTGYNSDFKRKVGLDKQTGEIIPGKTTTREQDQQMLRDFARLRKLSFRMMKLPKVEAEHAHKLYGVHAIPQLVVIDRKGIVRMIRVGSRAEKLDAIEAEIRKQLDRK
jgi:thiol-disulfide isomerase/thioredoxin